jgi:hypothetical protein
MESLFNREAGPTRIVGASPEQEKALLETFSDKVRKQREAYCERPKTPEERQLIDVIVRYLSEFLARYDCPPVVSLTADAVHMIDPARLSSADRSDLGKLDVAGFYDVREQAVFVLPGEDRLTTAQRISHELLHFNSFAAFGRAESGAALPLRRIGFGVFDRAGTKRYFRDMDEAIIEELVIRFDQHYFSRIGLLSNEIQRRDELRMRLPSAVGIAAVHTSQTDEARWQTTIERYRYAPQRAALKELIQEIFERNRHDFESKEDVFRLFVRGSLTGRLLEIARLIERAFGKGSFRALAEGTTNDELDAA